MHTALKEPDVIDSTTEFDSQQIGCMDEAALDDVQSVSLVTSTEHYHNFQITDGLLEKSCNKSKGRIKAVVCV